jgi:hypothetical protein
MVVRRAYGDCRGRQRNLNLNSQGKRPVAVADLASRGLLFRGALGTLASYCVCIAAVKQRQAVLDANLTDRAAFIDQMKAAAMTRALAVELGLTVTSRSRAFQGKSADERDWGELEVG